MLIPKIKKIPLWFVDVVATVKNLQVTLLVFLPKIHEFKWYNKKLFRYTFRAAEPNSVSTKRNADTKKETLGNVHPREKSNGHFIFSMMTNFHFKFSGLPLGSRLCVQSSTSKSCQNRFATKITGESVWHNPIDLQMFSKQVMHGREK